MQSAKCKIKSVGGVVEARRVVRTLAALCSENRQARERAARKPTWPTRCRSIDSRRHGCASELRRSEGCGKSRRLCPQAQHRLEGTARVTHLASIHYPGRAFETCSSATVAGGVRRTLPDHREIHRYRENSRVEGNDIQHRRKCKVRSAKLKVQKDGSPGARVGFELCILHFALTTSPSQ